MTKEDLPENPSPIQVPNNNCALRAVATLMCTGRALYRFFSIKQVSVAARIAMTLLFVFLVSRGVHRNDIVGLVAHITPIPCVIALMLGGVSLFMQVARWRIILRAHHFPSDTAVAARTMFKGYLLAFVTPGRVGELLRAVELDPSRRRASVLAVFEERFFGIIAIVGTGVTAVVLEVILLRHAPFYPLLIASLLFTGVCAVVISVIVGKLTVPVRLGTMFPQIAQWLKDSNARTAGYPVFLLIVLSFGSQLFLLAQTALLLWMFGASGGAMNLLVAAQAYTFMLLLPFFIANIGLREYAFSFFLMRFTSNPLLLPVISGVALGSATGILLFNIMLPAAVGLIWFHGEKHSTKAGV